MTINLIKTVDEYLDEQPEKVRKVLSELRETIKQTAPKAEEVISYQMPAYKQNGILVYFAAFKNHCSFFPGNSTLVEELKGDLKEFKTAKGTIQFTVDHPLPAALVKKIVKLRLLQNQERIASKQLQKK